MMPRIARFVGAALVLIAGTASGAPLDTPTFDRLVERSMAKWEVPGVAVAALDRGRLILFRTYGLGDVERQLAVTPRTLFAVGSIAKSFTVAALARMAARGDLNWDTAVQEYLPALRFRSFGNSRPVTIRDLVSHRSGMHRHDALWYLHAYDRHELVSRLRHLEPLARPGDVFQYSNIGVAAAGQVAAAVARQSWESLIRTEILERAKMVDTRLAISAFTASPDRATGYFPGDEGRIAIPLRDTTAIAPAAAVYSNLHDMARWLSIFLGGGRIDGEQVLEPGDVSEILTSRITVAAHSGLAELGPVDYGMGFYLTAYRGERLARHPGVIDGYAALMSFMPKRRIGVVVLTNMSGRNPLPAVVSYGVYDRLLGHTPVPWFDRFASAERVRARRGMTMPQPATGEGTPATASLSAYRGTYHHPAYGAIQIVSDGSQGLAGRLHGIEFPLQHVSRDIWEVTEVRWPLRSGLRMQFHIGAAGRADRLVTPLADGPTYTHNPGELTFRRLPKRRDETR